MVITADEGLRGGKKVPLKANVDAAIAKTGGVDWVVVVKRTAARSTWTRCATSGFTKPPPWSMLIARWSR